ncbi:protein doublesex-like [Choristoneura fumiferana]|uniref:protein doublesex-like n=1 Tax=Choristoneura fumiferana TaxID=7141 RepID=UPI003D1578F8
MPKIKIKTINQMSDRIRNSEIRKRCGLKEDVVTKIEKAVALDTLVENCHKLLEKFHYSWEMMPLIFVILNYAGSDLDEASRKIDEGKVFINEYARKHNLNIFDGLELRNSTRHSIADPDEKRHLRFLLSKFQKNK